MLLFFGKNSQNKLNAQIFIAKNWGSSDKVLIFASTKVLGSSLGRPTEHWRGGLM
jgi:hypothetical protein